MKHRFLAFGIKHELAIRWPLWDWYRSNKVARQINDEIADSSIYNLIMKNQPALVGRLGGTEARFLGEFKKISSSRFFNTFIFKVKPNWKKGSEKLIPTLVSILKALVKQMSFLIFIKMLWLIQIS